VQKGRPQVSAGAILHPPRTKAEDKERSMSEPIQTIIIEAYGRQFVFNIPHDERYSAHQPQLDDETRTCVLVVDDEIISPE
jgi:hypothetical protein